MQFEDIKMPLQRTCGGSSCVCADFPDTGICWTYSEEPLRVVLSQALKEREQHEQQALKEREHEEQTLYDFLMERNKHKEAYWTTSNDIGTLQYDINQLLKQFSKPPERIPFTTPTVPPLPSEAIVARAFIQDGEGGGASALSDEEREFAESLSSVLDSWNQSAYDAQRLLDYKKHLEGEKEILVKRLESYKNPQPGDFSELDFTLYKRNALATLFKIIRHVVKDDWTAVFAGNESHEYKRIRRMAKMAIRNLDAPPAGGAGSPIETASFSDLMSFMKSIWTHGWTAFVEAHRA